MHALERDIEDVRTRATTDNIARAEYAAYLRGMAAEMRRMPGRRLAGRQHAGMLAAAVRQLEVEAEMYERPLARPPPNQALLLPNADD
jgi:hypothetical protein